MTLSSSCPASEPKDKARSLPIASKQHMFITSGITGLTLPGMIDDPGAIGGKLISDSPHLGPEASNLRSLHTFDTFTATFLMIPEKYRKAPTLELASMRSSARVIGKPVTSRNSFTTVAEKLGS